MMVITIQISIFEGDPDFSIYCLINSFLHEQLLWQSVLIFSYLAKIPLGQLGHDFGAPRHLILGMFPRCVLGAQF